MTITTSIKDIKMIVIDYYKQFVVHGLITQIKLIDFTEYGSIKL